MCEKLTLCVCINENDCMCFYVNVWVWVCISMLCVICAYLWENEDDHFVYFCVKFAMHCNRDNSISTKHKGVWLNFVIFWGVKWMC